MQALDPISITGAPVEVQLEGQGRGIFPGSIKVDNESPYALKLQLGGDQHWLNPWTANVYPVPLVSTLRVVPVALATPVPSAPQSTILVTVAGPGEQIPGVYPCTLDRQTSSYAQPTKLGNVSAAANGTNSKSFPLPAGAVSVGYGVDISGNNLAPVSVSITGDQTGTVYRTDNTPATPPVHPSLLMADDTSITVSLNAGATNSARVDVYSWPVPVNSTATPDTSVSAPVTFKGAQAAPWQSPLNGGFGTVIASIASGGSLTLIAGNISPLQTIDMWDLGWSFVSSATTNGLFQSSDGVVTFGAWATNAGLALGPYRRNLGGLPLPAGKGLVMTNAGGVASPAFVVDGSFSQQ